MVFLSNAQIDVVYNSISHVKQYDGSSTSLVFNLPLNTSYTVKPLYIEKYAITSPIEVSANNNVEETHTISYNQDKMECNILKNILKHLIIFLIGSQMMLVQI